MKAKNNETYQGQELLNNLALLRTQGLSKTRNGIAHLSPHKRLCDRLRDTLIYTRIGLLHILRQLFHNQCRAPLQ